jgi:SAM-dependent methyltransferase
MSRKWWFILVAMLLTATLYRNRLRAYLEQASANVRDFDLPSAGAYDALVATVLEGLYARVAGEVGAAHPGGNLLEVGSGPGRLAVRLAREAPGMTLTGVDISDVMVELAARRAARAGLSERVRFEVGDVAVLPLSDEDVDGVVSTSPCTTGRTRPAGGPRSTGSSSPAGRHGSTISPTGCGDLREAGTGSPNWRPRALSVRGKRR